MKDNDDKKVVLNHDEKPKHAGGRPTKYSPEMIDECIRLMREGASITEIAYELNVAKDTIYEWKKVHPEFSDAIKKGVDFSEGWWMKEGRINIQNKEFNSTLFYMNMKNRFGWADKQEITQGNESDQLKAEISALRKDLADKNIKDF